MLTLEGGLRELLEDLVQDLISKHKELGMEVSGEWIDSLEVESSSFKGSILGNDYTEQLVQGREPGTLPPVDNIERWVNAKLGITGDQSRSIAWAVATKIKQSGTTWYQQGGTDLIDDVINDERVQELFRDLGNQFALTVNEDLQRQLQQLFAA